jgi:voltage-gated potassium channel
MIMNNHMEINGNLTSTQKLRIAIIGLGIVMLGGSIGFMIIEDLTFIDAVYTTVITLSTVGYGDITPHDSKGRVFVLLLIVFGVLMVGFTVTVIGQIVLEGQLKEFYGRRKMENKISKMSNHFIIAGYGRVGRQVALEFQKKNVKFVILEKENSAIMNIYKDKALFVQGDATDDDVLRNAGIEKASTLISTLPDEALNVYLTLTARDMNRDLKIIARADYDDGVKKLKRAGADHVVTPHVLGGLRMAMASLRPNVVDFMHSTALGEGGLTIEEMLIPDGCSLAGKTLRESNLKQEYGINIIGIKKLNEDMSISPGPDTILNSEDILVLIGHEEKLEKLSKAMTK